MSKLAKKRVQKNDFLNTPDDIYTSSLRFKQQLTPPRCVMTSHDSTPQPPLSKPPEIEINPTSIIDFDNLSARTRHIE